MKQRLSKRFTSRDQKLVVSGVPIETIAEKVPTPFYLYDSRTIQDSLRALKNSLPQSVKLFFSVKANPNVAVCSVLRKLGAGAEIASHGELEVALRAGFKPGNIIFAGPGHSEEDLRCAIRNNIRCINVESLTELRKIDEISRKLRVKTTVCFRMNLDWLPTSTIRKKSLQSKSKIQMVTMVGAGQKFGFDTLSFINIVEQLGELKNVRPIGFHIYLGTQIRKTEVFVQGIQILFNWLKQNKSRFGFVIRVINFGGGFGIPIDQGDEVLDLRKLSKGLGRLISRFRSHAGFQKTEFFFEPGRFLVGPSGIYVSRVIDQKITQGKTFLITDGGINHSLLPIAINKNYPIFILNRFHQKTVSEYEVCGPLCLSLDSFSRPVRFPKVEIGDLVGIFQSGAYGFSASLLYFLSHPLPAEVLVDGGRWEIVRKNKDSSDFLRDQTYF